jgi:hypothetical protein
MWIPHTVCIALCKRDTGDNVHLTANYSKKLENLGVPQIEQILNSLLSNFQSVMYNPAVGNF